MFLGKTLYSHSASLHQDILMGSGGHARGNLLMASIPSGEGGSRNTPSHFVLQIPGIRRSANTHTEVNQLIK